MSETPLYLESVQQRDVVSVPADALLGDGLRTMAGHRISCLVVMQDHRPVGIFTERDMVRLAATPVDLRHAPIGEVMSRSLITAPQTLDCTEAHALLLENGVRHLVVVDEAGALTGIVTETDLLHHLGIEYFLEHKDLNAVMTREIVCLGTTDSIADAMQRMASARISCVLVKDGSRVVGLLTERDLVRLLAEGLEIGTVPLADVMSHPLRIVPLGASLHQAVETMKAAHIRRLVVMQGEHLAGLITEHDIVKGVYGKYVEHLKTIIERQAGAIEQTRRHAEQLAQRSNLLKTIFDSTPDLMVLKDRSSVYLQVNAAFCRFVGRREEEILGKRDIDLFPYKEAQKYRNDDTRIMASGDPLVQDEEVTTPAGRRWMYMAKTPVHDAAGEVYGILVTGRDITDRKQAEQALSLAWSESAENYRRIVETAQEGIWILDQESRTLFVNPHMATMLGYAAGQMLGRSLFEFMDEPAMEAAALNFERCRQGFNERSDYRFTHREGRDVWTLISSSPILGEDGDFQGALAMVTDITERKRTDEALRRSEEQLDSMFRSAAAGMVTATLTGDFTRVNPEFCRLLGYAESELLQQGLLDITHPDDRDAVREKLRETASGASSGYQLEPRYVRKDGTVLWCLVSVGLVRDGSGTAVSCVALVQDITEKKRLERQRLALAEVQRDTLVREVHHRIKNHLQGVIGLLRQHLGKSSIYQDDLLKGAISQVETVAVVHGILGRRQGGELDPAAMFKAIATSVESLVGGQVQWRHAPHPAVHWSIIQDKMVAIALVANELLVNAVKHGTGPEGRAGILASMSCDGERALLSVSNPGKLPVGFDLASGAGLGTGLELVRSMLPSQGAALRIEEEAGRVFARLALFPPTLTHPNGAARS